MLTNTLTTEPVRKLFFRYLIPSICGTMVTSIYVLADTIIIGKGIGIDAMAALNIVLPLFNIFFGTGLLFGVGGSVLMSIARGKGDTQTGNCYFSVAVLLNAITCILYMILFLNFMEPIARFLGATDVTMPYVLNYAPYVIWGLGFFAFSTFLQTFVRNDGAPSIAMCATLFSSLFNIVFDYILMFPLGLGMEGAALATAISPIIGILICCIHFCSDKCSVKLKPTVPSVKRLFYSCQVGVSSFVAEISSGVITIVFNMIILRLAGNIGVAAYGVVANTSLVAVALFNGIAQGSQPLISDYYGRGLRKNVGSILRMAVVSSLLIAALLILFICTFAPFVTSVFNSEHDARLASYAESGLRLYFTGFIFAGINIVGSAILSAVESVKYAFAASIMRGFIAISIFAFALSAAFGMTGVWLAFPAAEFVTMFIIVKGLRRLKL